MKENVERIIHEAEELGGDYVSKTTVDLAVKISRYKDGGLPIKEAYELVIDTNGWVRFITDEQEDIYQRFRYRFFATTDGYRIVRADEQPEKGWLEVNVDVRQHYNTE